MQSVIKQLFPRTALPGLASAGPDGGDAHRDAGCSPVGSRLPANPLPSFSRIGFGIIPVWFGVGLQRTSRVLAAGPCGHLRASCSGIY